MFGASPPRFQVVYGVNTGFGSFQNVSLPADKLGELQVNLILSHAAGAELCGAPPTLLPTHMVEQGRLHWVGGGGGHSQLTSPPHPYQPCGLSTALVCYLQVLGSP
jgi:hypothetical protein